MRFWKRSYRAFPIESQPYARLQTGRQINPQTGWKPPFGVSMLLRFRKSRKSRRVPGTRTPPWKPRALAEPSRAASSASGEGSDVGNVRAGFIAAARRASQGGAPILQEVDGSASGPQSQGVHTQHRPFGFIADRAASQDVRWQPEASVVRRRVAGRADEFREIWRRNSMAVSPPAVSALTVSAAQAFPAMPVIHPDASNLAIQASSGAGIPGEQSPPNDRAAAARLLELDAEAGVVPAQRQIAEIYEKGSGVQRDLQRAYAWYERASHAGNLRAMHSLATLLASGSRGAPDYPGAFRWYAEAAEGGLRDSQFNLGVLLTRGTGVPRNLPRAYQWFDVAAKQGDRDAAEKRDEIARQMAPPELAAAKLLAQRWRARPYDQSANGVARPTEGRTAALDPSAGARAQQLHELPIGVGPEDQPLLLAVRGQAVVEQLGALLPQ